MLAQYRHLEPFVSFEPPSVMPSRFHDAARELAYKAWERERLKTCYNKGNGSLMFYRMWYGRVQVYGVIRLQPGDFHSVFEAMLEYIRLGKRTNAEKDRFARNTKDADRSHLDDIKAGQDAENSAELEHVISYQDEVRGMGKHYKKTHLVRGLKAG